MIIKRILQNIERRKRAKRFDISFSTLKGFSVPQTISIGHKNISLQFPGEKGVWSAFVEIFLEDGYCLHELSKQPIKTIVDVGANIGFFSVCARHYFPQANITAYEPNYHLEKFLSHHLQQVNAKYLLEAVGKKNAKIDLQLHDDDSIMTTVKENGSANVQQRSIADVIRDTGGSIDLLKLDCEGAEWQILQDISSMQKVNWLVMEYHLFGQAGSALEDMISLLDKNNFHVLKTRTDAGFGFILAKRKN